MDADLICNFPKCRKILQGEAWVTSCSHIFCAVDGIREFNKSLACPACNTTFSGKYDAIKVDLNPTEEYKAVMLAGLNPDTIMEIASRAMSFWSYQVHQELEYRNFLASKCLERQSQMEQANEQVLVNCKSEINNINQELQTAKQELLNQMQRSAELSEKLTEKSRQLQKVQCMYESLRRTSVLPLNCYDRRQCPPEEDTILQSPSASLRELSSRTTGFMANRASSISHLVTPSKVNKSKDTGFPFYSSDYSEGINISTTGSVSRGPQIPETARFSFPMSKRDTSTTMNI